MTTLRTLTLSAVLALTASAALASDGEIGRADQQAAREVDASASAQRGAAGRTMVRPDAGLAEYRAHLGAPARAFPAQRPGEPWHFTHASRGGN